MKKNTEVHCIVMHSKLAFYNFSLQEESVEVLLA